MVRRFSITGLVLIWMVCPTAAATEVLWGAERQLTSDSAWSYVGYNNARSIVTDGNDVHVVMADNRVRLYTSEIMYIHSGDGGASWDPGRIMADTAANSAAVAPNSASGGALGHFVIQASRVIRHSNFVIRHSVGGSSRRGAAYPSRPRLRR